MCEAASGHFKADVSVPQGILSDMLHDSTDHHQSCLPQELWHIPQLILGHIHFLSHGNAPTIIKICEHLDDIDQDNVAYSCEAVSPQLSQVLRDMSMLQYLSRVFHDNSIKTDSCCALYVFSKSNNTPHIIVTTLLRSMLSHLPMMCISKTKCLRTYVVYILDFYFNK